MKRRKAGKGTEMAYKILIIDDDAELLKMLRSYFEIKKYEIVTAENGAEGLSKIKLQPDLILLDINCNAALYSRRKKHFIFDSINTITAPSFR